LKVLVLAIDGLDYELVNRWNMKTYKQSYYGKSDVRVAVRSGEPLYTPLIWSSFLLGKPSYLFGLNMEKIREDRAKILYKKIYPLFKLKKKLFRGKSLHIRDFLIRIGLADFDSVVKNLSRIEAIPQNAMKYTFVAEAKNRGYKVFYKDFPTLKESRYAEMRAIFSKYFTLPFNEKISKLKEVFDYGSKLLDEVVNAIEGHDLLLYYTSLIDYAQHMLYKPKNFKYIAALYSTYKKLANLIAESIPSRSDLCILILSDHGFDPINQTHSDYGFWSMNVKPPKKPKTILDFKDIILELLSF